MLEIKSFSYEKIHIDDNRLNVVTKILYNKDIEGKNVSLLNVPPQLNKGK